MDQAHRDSIAKLIRDARRLKGLSQQELADLAQLNLRSVQRIENAEVQPRSSNLKRLATGLELDAALLIGEKSSATGHEPVADEGSKRLNKPRKLILTIMLGVLTVWLTAAYLSLSLRFPETSFELFLLLAGVSCGYAMVLWFIWRNAK